MLNARELYQEDAHFESVGLQDDDLRGGGKPETRVFSISPVF
jgi:hypothetical protein